MNTARNTTHARLRARAIVAALAMGSATAVNAADDDAKALLKAMSDYVAAQPSLSFDYDSILEVVTKEQQKLQFASSGTIAVKRPDKIRVTRTGGFADLVMVYDGNLLSLYGKNLKSYAQVESKGTLEQFKQRLAEAGIEPPASDLFSADIFAAMMDGVTDAKHVASAYIDGVECEYLAFRTPDVDWQIWVQAGDRPIPRRYVITSKHIAQAPQYSIETSNWKDGTAVAANDFKFVAPKDAKKVEVSDLGDIDELPSPVQ